MKKAKSILLFILALLTFISCAKRGNPDGGPKDAEPPRFVRANPENFTTNFDAKEIRIFFDEYIKLNEAQRQIIISPPMDPRPEITPLGSASRSVRIRINDTLQPNTTYTINFGRSIVDNNEGNPLNFFQYVFSTGNYIDSLSVTGTISDAFLIEPDPFISVMLYEVNESYTDSVVYHTPPRYVTNSLDSTTFQFDYLKEGTYRMIALKDDNSNYRFEPGIEKIAFLKDFITIPTDSVYDLSLFREVPAFTATRPQQLSQQHLIFGYNGRLDKDSIAINMISPTPEGFDSRITKDPATDTLHYWYKPLIERDSLQLTIQAPTYTDTFFLRRRTMKKDSLQFTFDPAGTVLFNQNINILPSIPLTEVNDSRLRMYRSDSIPIPFQANYSLFDNRVILSFEKQENSSYSFEALPGAFTGFYGTGNDTIRTQFKTRSFSDYGTASVNLQNVNSYPIIVEITNEKGVVQARKQSDSESNFNFPYLKPGKFLLRVIYDENGNGIWDTGNFLEQQQPEEIIYYPEVIEVRPNWEDIYTFPL